MTLYVGIYIIKIVKRKFVAIIVCFKTKMRKSVALIVLDIPYLLERTREH